MNNISANALEIAVRAETFSDELYNKRSALDRLGLKMFQNQMLMECSGSAVRSRHCPAAVSGDQRLHDATAPK